MHPYHQSSLATRVLKAQVNLPVKYADTLWQQIIIAKIENQRRVLEVLQKEYSKLEKYKHKVLPADKYGAEAKSARVYWSKLFDGLIREQESFDIRNQALNYTYALVRSLITRDLSAAGFLPALGIWHKSEFNAFNLSDDLMEPFRPIVDIGVYYILDQYSSEEMFNSEMKRALIALLDTEYLEFEEGSSSIRNVCKLYIQQFKRSVLSVDTDMVRYPKFDHEKLYECI